MTDVQIVQSAAKEAGTFLVLEEAETIVAALAAAGRLVTPKHDAQVLRTYADELAKNPSAEVWDKEDFVHDARQWADSVSEGIVS